MLLLKFLFHVTVSLPVEVEMLSRGVFKSVGLLVVQLAFEAAQDSWALWRSMCLMYDLIGRLPLAAARLSHSCNDGVWDRNGGVISAFGWPLSSKMLLQVEAAGLRELLGGPRPLESLLPVHAPERLRVPLPVLALFAPCVGVCLLPPQQLLAVSNLLHGSLSPGRDFLVPNVKRNESHLFGDAFVLRRLWLPLERRQAGDLRWLRLDVRPLVLAWVQFLVRCLFLTVFVQAVERYARLLGRGFLPLSLLPIDGDHRTPGISWRFDDLPLVNEELWLQICHRLQDRAGRLQVGL